MQQLHGTLHKRVLSGDIAQDHIIGNFQIAFLCTCIFALAADVIARGLDDETCPAATTGS